MKKLFAFAAACLMAAALLTGCGGGSGIESGSGDAPQKAEETVPVNQIKTLGDAFTYEDRQTAYDESRYVYVFDADGVYYRAVAELPPDVSAAIWELDFDDESRDEKITALTAPLEISRLDNLSELIPAQEELDQWVGKTGQDMLDDGWTNWGYNLETMECYMDHGLFSYIVVFNYDGPQMENDDDFDWEESFSPLTIKSVTFDGLGDATELD